MRFIAITLLILGTILSACIGSGDQSSVHEDATISITDQAISVSSSNTELSHETIDLADVQMFTATGARIGLPGDGGATTNGSIRCAKCVCDLNKGTCVCEDCVLPGAGGSN